MNEVYLSRFLFEKTPEGMRALTDRYYLHALARGMGRGGRYLFRLETAGSAPALLLQTASHPDLTALPEGALRLVGVKRLPKEALRPGLYRFFLQANLTWTDPEGKRRPLPLEEARARLERELSGARTAFAEVRRKPPLWVSPPGRPAFPLDVVEARGVLEVTDPEALFEGVAKGIGRGKAYGLGLLSLAPARAERRWTGGAALLAR